MKKTAAIYVIVNKINHKIYLGSTNNFRKRLREHWRSLKNTNHYNKHLQAAWDKNGVENFAMFPIEEFDNISLDLLVEMEGEYIKKFNLVDANCGYNIIDDPVKMPFGSAIKRIQSRRSNGRPWHSDEWRKCHSRNMKGRENSPRSEEHKRNLSLNHYDVSGKNNPMYSKHHTKTTIEKIRLARSIPNPLVQGESNPQAKLSEKNVRNIISLGKSGVTHKKLSKLYKVSRSLITAIINRRAWKYLTI